MAAHADIGNAYAEPDDGALQRRFLGGCVGKAGAILSENPQTTNHAARVAWAMSVLSDDPVAVNQVVRQAKNHALAVDADVRFSPENVLDASIDAAIENWLAIHAVDPS